MEKTVILGIGNHLMRDDGIGMCVVEKLAEHQQDFDAIQYVIGESDIDYCLKKIEGASCVLIVDAVISGKKPGDVSLFCLSDLHEQQDLTLSPHNLHLFNALYHERDRIKGYVIGIEPHDISFHLGLSKQLNEKLSDITAHAEKIIKEITVKKWGG
ncbi:hydrogenase maturation protease [Salipaludibacillus aurantiacus]|uniref:Hydrogenase maturation protease n=1 Tax=Salipaludibacillus aurantiacus TaxID=1601833 RepID=A0A1H9SBM7_9BACI|nr:hydrogenase maturation protease [Salipaludibacillus aurantiacus]SER81975.1 hydrogenase maturation protease [Salipaludibacillus aurantiacus]